MRFDILKILNAALPSKLLKWINGDAASLVLRQLLVAALFFLSNIVLMARVKGIEFTNFIDAQNAAYLLIAVVIGGLQPSLMYFSIRNDRKIRGVLELAMALTAVGVVIVGALSYLLALLGGAAFGPAFLLAVALLISSTFPYFLLAAGRITLFSGLEVIPNAIFLVLALLTDDATSYVDLILYFVTGHALKSAICLAAILNIARGQTAAKIDKSAFFSYFFSSGAIGLGHAAIQRMPPLLISNFFPPLAKVSVLSAWVLLDRSLAIQQSINLWLFQMNASGGLSRKGMTRVIGITACIAFVLPFVLSGVIAVAMNFGIRGEYRDAPLAILLMAPAFMFACLRTSLQSIAMSDGRNRIVMANVAITAGLMGSLFLLREAGIVLVSIWITATLSVSTVWYIVLQRRRS